MSSSPDSYLILYNTEDGRTRIEVRLLDETTIERRQVAALQI